MRQEHHKSSSKGWMSVVVILLLVAAGVFAFNEWQKDRARTRAAIQEAQDAAALAQARAAQAEAAAQQRTAQLQQQLQDKEWRDGCIRNCDIESRKWMGGCRYASSTNGNCQCRCVDVWNNEYYVNQ